MKKRGDVDPALNFLIGTVIAFLLIVGAVGCGLKLYNAYTQTQLGISSFNGLVKEINKLEVGKETIFPYYIDEGFTLLFWNKNEEKETMTVGSPYFIRPDSCKRDNEMPTCLCLCEGPLKQGGPDVIWYTLGKVNCIQFLDIGEFKKIGTGTISGSRQEDFTLGIKKEKISDKIIVNLIIK